MTPYFKLPAFFACVLIAILGLPTTASAGCPGCEEYVLDVPEKEPDPAPAEPAPAAPAPAPAPAAPTTTPVPTEPTVVEEPEPEPVDTDPDPVPKRSDAPAPLERVPAIAAARADPTAGDDPAGALGLLPLAIAMAAIALIGVVAALRDARNTGAERPRRR